MDAHVATRVDAFWARLFPTMSAAGGTSATSGSDLCRVAAHRAALHGYPGVYCIVRDGRGWVSAPPELEPTVRSWRPARDEATSAGWWLERLPGWTFLGPSVHSFTGGAVPVPTPRATVSIGPAAPDQLARLRGLVRAEDWSEAGFERDDVGPTWVAADATGAVLAAANLTTFDGCSSDVGVVTAPGVRGQGLASSLAATAATWAVDSHGLARWRSLEANLPSRHIAAALGFEDDCTQIAVRPG